MKASLKGYFLMKAGKMKKGGLTPPFSF